MKNQTITYIAAACLSLLATTQASAGLFDNLTKSLADAVDGINQKVEEKRLKEYEAVQDKQLLEAFYPASEDGKKRTIAQDIKTAMPSVKFVKLTPSSITLSFGMFRANTMASISSEMSRYTYQTQDDAIGKKYLSIAEMRGNTVKNYRPQLGSMINNFFDQHFIFTTIPHIVNWIDKDNVLIEYSPSGSIVSFMTRSHQASTGYGVLSDQYTNIYFGATNAQVLENNIGNNVFENNFLRVASLSSNPAATNSSNTIPLTNTQETTLDSPQDSSSNVIGKPSGTAILIRPGKPDILVATQGDDMAPIRQREPAQGNPDKRLQMLIQLGELKKSGVLTDQEFLTEKQRILGN